MNLYTLGLLQDSQITHMWQNTAERLYAGLSRICLPNPMTISLSDFETMLQKYHKTDTMMCFGFTDGVLFLTGHYVPPINEAPLVL